MTSLESVILSREKLKIDNALGVVVQKIRQLKGDKAILENALNYIEMNQKSVETQRLLYAEINLILSQHG